MQRDEFKKIVALLNAVYNDKPPIPTQVVFDCWEALLGDKPYALVAKAVNDYVATEHFAPKPADILTRCAELLAGDDMSELEAWGLVYKAICNSTYNSEREFEKLPDICKKAIGSAAMLKEMAGMDIDTVNSVEQSHFIRNYRTELLRTKQQRATPQNLLNAINGKMLEAKNDY